MAFTWNHVLYRLYDVSGDLLYIGLTKDIRSRFNQHVAKSAWWPEVADCRIEFLPSWEALKAAEVARSRRRGPDTTTGTTLRRSGSHRWAAPEVCNG